MKFVFIFRFRPLVCGPARFVSGFWPATFLVLPPVLNFPTTARGLEDYRDCLLFKLFCSVVLRDFDGVALLGVVDPDK